MLEEKMGTLEAALLWKHQSFLISHTLTTLDN